MAIFAEVTENECIIERHLRDIDPPFTIHCEDRPVFTSVVYMPDMAEGPKAGQTRDPSCVGGTC